MKKYSMVTVTIVSMIFLAGCMPIRSIVRDGMGREMPLANGAIASIIAAGEPGLYEIAWDAAPDPDASTIYFVADSKQGNGLFSVPAEGGEEVAVAIGSPFAEPVGLAVSSDGQTVYVADPAAEINGAKGAVFAVSIADGIVIALPATDGSMPRGIEVKNVDGSDVIFFSGVDPKAGQVAVMSIAANGGELNVLAKGEPFVMPMGVAISDAGAVYVADRNGSGEGWGSVFRIIDGKVEQIADYFRTGPVVGATLTLDQSLLLVSALDAGYDSAQVLAINLATGDKLAINKGIARNFGSGGVHRAHNRNIFAWADAPNPGRGRGCCAVYNISAEQ